MSPSMRREWIEILSAEILLAYSMRSPSMRREWIEIPPLYNINTDGYVSLHAEGVD